MKTIFPWNILYVMIESCVRKENPILVNPVNCISECQLRWSIFIIICEKCTCGDEREEIVLDITQTFGESS